MKNIFLKINMVLIFVVILFANFSYAADIVHDSSVELLRAEEGLFSTKYVLKPKVNGEYSFVVTGEQDSITIDTKGGVNNPSITGKGVVVAYLSNDDNITYEVVINDNSSLTVAEGNIYDGSETAPITDLSEVGTQQVVNLTDIPQAGAAEKVFSMYFLDFGDYAQKFLEKIFKEEVTVDKIIFNKVEMLNANFFYNTTNAASNELSSNNIVRIYINQWFGYFKSLALVIIMVSIVAAGIRILLQTPQSKVKGYESMKKVVMAVSLIFFFPYVMRFAFEINEAIIGYIENSNTYGNVGAVNISPYADADEDDLEFRSPKYVSIEGRQSSSSSSDNTEIYLSKITLYENNVDIMRLIRAFAGVTYRFVYVALWYIMLAQVYILAFIYIKRYLTIAFLIIIYPLVIAGYVVEGVIGKRKGSFNTWCKEFFSTVFKFN